MLLVKIFSYDFDTGWLIFVLGLIGAVIGLIFKLWTRQKIDAKFESVESEIKTNRDTTTASAATIKAELALEIERKRKESQSEHLATKEALELQIKNIELLHKKDVENITTLINNQATMINNHMADDRAQFLKMNTSLESLTKDIAESKGMLFVLTKDAHITFPEK